MASLIQIVEAAAAFAQLATTPSLFIVVIVFFALIRLAPVMTGKASGSGASVRRAFNSIPSRQRRLAVAVATAAVILCAIDIADIFGFKDWIIEKLPLTDIYDKDYDNERVVLDGYYYHHCKFENVKFVYNGGRFGLRDSEIGAFRVMSNNPTIERTFIAANVLGLLRADVIDKSHGHDSIIQPFGINPTFPSSKPSPDSSN